MSRSLVAVYVVAALVSGLLVGRFSAFPLPFDKPATPATAPEVSVSGDRLTAFERGQLQVQCYEVGRAATGIPNLPNLSGTPPRNTLDECLNAVKSMP